MANGGFLRYTEREVKSKMIWFILAKLVGLYLIILSAYRMFEDYKETGMLFRMCYVVPFVVGLVMVAYHDR